MPIEMWRASSAGRRLWQVRWRWLEALRGPLALALSAIAVGLAALMGRASLAGMEFWRVLSIGAIAILVATLAAVVVGRSD
jgi:hypothetical protein